MVPPKSIHFPLRKKRGKQREEEEEGAESKMEGKDRVGSCGGGEAGGGGGQTCMVICIILFHSSTVTGRDVTPRQRAEMHRWRRVNRHRSSAPSTAPPSESCHRKGHSDHRHDHLVMKMRLVTHAGQIQEMASPPPSRHGCGSDSF